MKAALVILALLASSAHAELVARRGSDTIHLTAGECTNAAVLEHIPQVFRPVFHAADASVGGKTYQACWRIAQGMAHLIYEDGDQGLIPLEDLKQDDGV